MSFNRLEDIRRQRSAAIALMDRDAEARRAKAAKIVPRWSGRSPYAARDGASTTSSSRQGGKTPPPNSGRFFSLLTLIDAIAPIAE